MSIDAFFVSAKPEVVKTLCQHFAEKGWPAQPISNEKIMLVPSPYLKEETLYVETENKLAADQSATVTIRNEDGTEEDPVRLGAANPLLAVCPRVC